MSRFRNEVGRKAVHVGMGGVAFTLRWLTPLQAAALALLALLFNLFVLHRLTRRALLRHDERERGFSAGIALYPAVILAAIVVFHSRLELAAGVWGLLAFGDGMAGVSGMLLGGPKLPWNPRKTWSGLLAFVLYGSAAAAGLVWWTQRAVLDSPAAAEWIGGSFLSGPSSGSALTFLIVSCCVAAAVAGFAESLDTGIDDNILVPLAGGVALYAATLVRPELLADQAARMGTAFLWGAAINTVLALAAYASRGVGVSGAVWGWILGTTLYGFGGWRGFLMLLGFFVLGTATTKLGYARKAALGIAQEKGGRRGAANALANVTTGVVFAFLAVATPYATVCSAALVAAFATATCDTVSSEIGQAYGRRHFLITSFRRVPPGTDGAVSLEGTLGGLMGALLLAALAAAVGLIGWPAAGLVTLAAFVGATLESYLGATVERMQLLDNELVNFTNTVVGALTAVVLYVLVLGTGS